LHSNFTRILLNSNTYLFSLDSGEALGSVNTGLTEKPRSIALHPVLRLLFWTDAGSQQAVIRAKMDGSDMRVLVTGLENVRAFALDPVTNRIFFVHEAQIVFMDIDGRNR
jgi:low density lipoprotein receptor-related protein 5/6